MPSIHDILAIKSDLIADFVQEMISAKMLNPLIKNLNEKLLAGDKMAALALEHLGFPEYA